MSRKHLLCAILICLSLTASVAALGDVITVTDDGAFSTSTTYLHAAWSMPAGADVIAYQYAVGTSPTDPGGGYRVPWTPTGQITEATLTALSPPLVPGTVYYFYVQGRNSVGDWVHSGVSDGIRVVTPVSTPAAAKLWLDGTWVQLSGRATSVSGNLPYAFYLESSDRTSGIQITTTSVVYSDVLRGKTVQVTGQLSTNSSGERTIIPSLISASGSESAVAAVAMSNRAIGGGPFSYTPGGSAGQMGVLGGAGLNNIGILVAAFGRVTHIEPYDPAHPLDQFMYIDDGSALGDGSPYVGLRVNLNGAPAPTGADPIYVKVTGIVCCGAGTPPARVLNVRDQNDVQVYGAPTRLSINGGKPLTSATGARYGNYRVTIPAPSPGILDVTLTVADGSVAKLALAGTTGSAAETISVSISTGATQSEAFDVIGVASGSTPGYVAGSTTVKAEVASIYDPGVSKVQVVQSAFAWNANGTHWTIAPIGFNLSIVDPNNPSIVYRAAQPTLVTVAGDDSGVLGGVDVTIPDNQSFVSGSLPVIGVGDSTVSATTASAPIGPTSLGSVTITSPALALNSASPVTGTAVRNAYNVTLPSNAPDDISVTVRSQDRLVAMVSPNGQPERAEQNVIITILKGNQASVSFDIIGVATAATVGAVAGTANIELAGNGVPCGNVPVTVYQTGFQVTASTPVALSAGNEPFTLKVGWGGIYGFRLGDDTSVTMTSTSTPEGVFDVLPTPLISRNATLVNAQAPLVTTGTGTLKASSSSPTILEGSSQLITVTGSTLTFTNTSMITGTGIKQAYTVRVSPAATSQIAITVSSADSSRVKFASAYNSSSSTIEDTTTVYINAGATTSGSFDVIGIDHNGTPGSAVGTPVTLTAHNLNCTDGTGTVTIYQTNFKVIPSTYSPTTLAPLSVTIQAGAPSPAPAQLTYPCRMAINISTPPTLYVTSSNPAALGDTSVSMVNNATFCSVNSPTVDPGQATLTATLSGAAPFIAPGTCNTITVSLPSITFSANPMIAPTRCRNQAYITIPSKSTSTTVTLHCTDPAVASLMDYYAPGAELQDLVLTLNPYATTAYFYVVGVASATTVGPIPSVTTTITATATGFSPGSGNVQAAQTKLNVAASASITHGNKGSYTIAAGDGTTTYQPIENITILVESSNYGLVWPLTTPVTFLAGTFTYFGTSQLQTGTGTGTGTTITMTPQSPSPVLPGTSNAITVN